MHRILPRFTRGFSDASGAVITQVTCVASIKIRLSRIDSQSLILRGRPKLRGLIERGKSQMDGESYHRVPYPAPSFLPSIESPGGRGVSHHLSKLCVLDVVV
jgi:hypothetical protein